MFIQADVFRHLDMRAETQLSKPKFAALGFGALDKSASQTLSGGHRVDRDICQEPMILLRNEHKTADDRATQFGNPNTMGLDILRDTLRDRRQIFDPTLENRVGRVDAPDQCIGIFISGSSYCRVSHGSRNSSDAGFTRYRLKKRAWQSDGSLVWPGFFSCFRCMEPRDLC